MPTDTRRLAAAIVLAMASLASTAYATPKAPVGADASARRASAAVPGSVVVLRSQAIVGRTAKPMVTFVLGRSFHAPTTLMSEDLWRAQLDKIASGER